MSDVVDGGCFCGAVKLHVTMPPAVVFHCHCSICRRLHSAPFVTWCAFPDAAVVVEGADKLVKLASSDHMTRERCGECGSWLTFRHANAGGKTFVSRAILGEHPKLAAAWHGFWGDRAKWVEVQDSLDKRG